MWAADDQPVAQPVVPVALRGEDRELPGQGTDPSWTGRLTPSDADRIVVSGAGYDSGWRAAVGGKDLGTPVLVNGWTTGWVVPAGIGGALTIDYGPQRLVVIGLLVTLLAAALSGAALWVARRPERLGLAGREVRVPGGGRPSAARHDSPSAPRPTNVPLRWLSRADLETLATVVGWALLGLLVGGVWGAVGALLGLALRLAPTRTSALVLVAAWGGVVAAWFLGVGPLLGTVTPALVAETGAASDLVRVTCLASLVWVWASEGGERREPATSSLGSSA